MASAATMRPLGLASSAGWGKGKPPLSSEKRPCGDMAISSSMLKAMGNSRVMRIFLRATPVEGRGEAMGAALSEEKDCERLKKEAALKMSTHDMAEK